MTERRCGEDLLNGCEQCGVLLECQSAHEDGARVDLLMRRLDDKVGKEIHSPKIMLAQRRTKSEYFKSGPGAPLCDQVFCCAGPVGKLEGEAGLE